MKFAEAVEVVQKYGYHLVRETQKPAEKDETELTEEEKIEMAKKIVTENGLRFIKNSKKYAGKHPVFNSKEFQDYLLKECGTDCCTCNNGTTVEYEDGTDQDPYEEVEVKICPECDGSGCECCDFNGYIDK